MERSEFRYCLPPELIAQAPARTRSASRLLVLDGATGQLSDRLFPDIVELLEYGDLLVLNDTRVVPARIHGRKESGGRVEILLDRIVSENQVTAQLRSSRSPVSGAVIRLPDGATARVVGRDGAMFRLEFDREASSYFEAHGRVPLPPYIGHEPTEADAERYQTVFARCPGAVAAPTAGLHFDEEIFARLDERGVDRGFITLHVGAGTFAPVRTEKIEAHRIHAERVAVGARLCAQIASTRTHGGRVVAVGTTVVRALETAAREGVVKPFDGDTELFIYPGFRFRVVDAMLTNFHLPESSLIMLVAAFAGHGNVMRAYRHAVAERYRFFSYGDAMFITPDPEARAVVSDAL